MKWLLLLITFVGGVYYYMINNRKAEMDKKTQELKTKMEMIKTAAEPALPTKSEQLVSLSFSNSTVNTIRSLTSDPNEKVRIAAIDLLWKLQDAQAPGLVKKMFQEDTEPVVKKAIIDMLAQDKSKLSLALLAEALKDYDKDTRMAAVKAIGSFANSLAISVLEKSLQDYDEDIKLAAVAAINQIRQDLLAHKEQQLRELDGKPLFNIQ